jgi:hypothetical protein
MPTGFWLLFVLDAGEYLFGPRNLCLWVLDVFFKSFLIPDDMRVFVRIRVVELGNAAGEPPGKSIEFGTDTVSSARTDFMADSAFLKGNRTLINILRKRQVSRGDQHRGRQQGFKYKCRCDLREPLALVPLRP